MLGDDVRHLGAVAAVDHPVDGFGDEEQRHHGVQRLRQVAEHRGVGDDHDGVDGQAQRTDGQAGQLQLQKPRRQLRAAGGGTVPQHQTAAETCGHATADGRQQRFHGLEGIQPRQQVDHAGADQRGVQRGVQPLVSHVLPAQNEQRQIQHHDHRADGRLGKEEVDDLGNTGKAAHAQVVGVKEPVKGDGVQCAGQGDHDVLHHDPLDLLIHKWRPLFFSQKCIYSILCRTPFVYYRYSTSTTGGTNRSMAVRSLG